MSDSSATRVTAIEREELDASRTRRSPRVPLAFRLWLRREQLGRTWEEETETRLVSRFGAGLECRHLIEPGARLAITRRDTGQRATARVTYCRFNEDGRREIGVELLDRDNFWDLDWETAVREAAQEPLADVTVSGPAEASASPAVEAEAEVSPADVSTGALSESECVVSLPQPGSAVLPGEEQAAQETHGVAEAAADKDAGEAADSSGESNSTQQVISLPQDVAAPQGTAPGCVDVAQSETHPQVGASPAPPSSDAVPRAIEEEPVAREGGSTQEAPCPDATPRPKRDYRDAFAQELIALQRRLWQALAQGNMQLLGNLVAHDAVWITSGGLLSGWEETAGEPGNNTPGLETVRAMAAAAALGQFRVVRLNRKAAAVISAAQSMATAEQPTTSASETAPAADEGSTGESFATPAGRNSSDVPGTTAGAFAAHHTSVWVQRRGRWRLVLHQIAPSR